MTHQDAALLVPRALVVVEQASHPQHPRDRIVDELILLRALGVVARVHHAPIIEHHFDRHHNIPSVLLALEWLSDIGVVDKASTPVKLTTRSQLEVDELAFFYSPDEE